MCSRNNKDKHVLFSIGHNFFKVALTAFQNNPGRAGQQVLDFHPNQWLRRYSLHYFLQESHLLSENYNIDLIHQYYQTRDQM